MDTMTAITKNVVELTFDDLPEEVVQKVKVHTLDQLGCQLAFATLPWSQSVYKYTQAKHSSGNSTVSYYGDKVNAEDAAFCNSAIGHGFELDDDDLTTSAHPGVAILPVAISLGEDQGASGKDTIVGAVAGLETMLRFCRAADSMRHRFFQCTAVGAAFGAAMAAGKLIGADEDVLRNALAIATTQASGNSEYSCSGGSVKRTLAAIGGYAGIRSALLAQAGITGPADAFEGRKSFIRTICTEEPVWDEFLVPFSEHWETLDVGIKPYCCCAAQHAVIDCGIKLRELDLNFDDIANIEILQLPFEVENVGVITDPHDVIESQFCGRFGLALRLVKGGNGFYDYTLENLADPAIRALMAKTDYRSDDDKAIIDQPNSTGARVTITMNDGTVYQELEHYALGSFRNPVSNEEVVDKFKSLTTRVVGEDRTQKIIDTVMRMDELEDIHELTQLLIV